MKFAVLFALLLGITLPAHDHAGKKRSSSTPAIIATAEGCCSAGCQLENDLVQLTPVTDNRVIRAFRRIKISGQCSRLSTEATTHTLDRPTVPVLAQTFEMVFQRYHGHREAKSFAPDEELSKADTGGLLKRYPVSATGFHLIGKETERGWEQNDDISTLMPSLLRYGSDTGIADEQLRKRLLAMSLALLESKTRLSRHTIVRARRGQAVHPRSVRLLKDVVRRVPPP